LETVRGIDAIFDIEREINGSRTKSLAALEEWMRAERTKRCRHNAVAKAIDYMLPRWPALTRFLDDGRICLTNNAAERALRGLALERKSWFFVSSAREAERAAVMYTLIHTAKLDETNELGDLVRAHEDQRRAVTQHSSRHYRWSILLRPVPA
jgi:hypothetical protein